MARCAQPVSRSHRTISRVVPATGWVSRSTCVNVVAVKQLPFGTANSAHHGVRAGRREWAGTRRRVPGNAGKPTAMIMRAQSHPDTQSDHADCYGTGFAENSSVFGGGDREVSSGVAHSG
ncbi:hypothetical protein GCM10027258_84760 [Amycolatopsis stemonae]